MRDVVVDDAVLDCSSGGTTILVFGVTLCASSSDEEVSTFSTEPGS